MRKKFLLTVGVLATMSFALVGCGSSSSSDSTTTESKKTEASATTGETSEENTDAASNIDGVGDWFEYIGQNSEQLPFTISPKAKSFLNDHPEVCSVKKVNDVKNIWILLLNTRKLKKIRTNLGIR